MFWYLKATLSSIKWRTATLQINLHLGPVLCSRCYDQLIPLFARFPTRVTFDFRTDWTVSSSESPPKYVRGDNRPMQSESGNISLNANDWYGCPLASVEHWALTFVMNAQIVLRQADVGVLVFRTPGPR